MHTFSIKSLNCLTNTKDLIKIIFCLLNFQKSFKKKNGNPITVYDFELKKKRKRKTLKKSNVPFTKIKSEQMNIICC